jgi:putative iron-dependent peroxidase
VLSPVPAHARFVVFELTTPLHDPKPALSALREQLEMKRSIVGLGAPLLEAMRKPLEGLHAFPAIAGPGVSVPSTQGALCAVLHGDDPGELLHRSRGIEHVLAPAFVPTEIVDAFTYAGGRDLTGYEDGTENPKADAAIAAAIMQGRGVGLDGGSFLSVQRWAHDLSAFEKRSRVQQDHIVGRSFETNEELADAPASAHTKRAAQETFDPPAFMLRRSMAFATAQEQGLVFVAYGASLQPFEQVLHRMLGLEDGVVDALFQFTKPRTGGHYFCPPLYNGRLELSMLGLAR